MRRSESNYKTKTHEDQLAISSLVKDSRGVQTRQGRQLVVRNHAAIQHQRWSGKIQKHLQKHVQGHYQAFQCFQTPTKLMESLLFQANLAWLYDLRHTLRIFECFVQTHFLSRSQSQTDFWNHLRVRWTVQWHDSNHLFNWILCESSGESMVGSIHELALAGSISFEISLLLSGHGWFQ